MERYKFVKVEAIEPKEGNRPTWYFCPESVEQIKQHWLKYPASVIREGSRRIANNVFKYGRPDNENISNEFEKAVISTHLISDNFLVCDMVQIENIAYNNRINDFENGREIYLTKGLPVVTIDRRFYRITEDIYRDTLTFPDEDKPTLEDVRYIQWEGGSHWYAKIGKIDVTDKYNRQKWNTKEQAKEAAQWFINNNW